MTSISEQFHQYFPEEKEVQEPLFSTSAEPEFNIILDKLNAKENQDNLMTFITDSGSIQVGEEHLKVVFLECILSKARKSLEHLKRYTEIYD
mmetsp:Transcript_41287/g.39761  ORF Transcript_41287/g.39761 Transcript_41287/m.39761 type:complete len:92 (-) Transcript_41287:646-921(-)